MDINKYVIVHGDVYGKKIADKLKHRGYKVLFHSFNLLFKKEPEFDIFIRGEEIGREQIPENLVGVINACVEKFVLPASQICEDYGLFGIKPREAQYVTDKKKLKFITDKHNILTPDYIITSSFRTAVLFADEINTDLVIKPVDNSSQRGVLRIQKGGFSRQDFEYSLSHSAQKMVLLEEYISGNEYEVTCIVVNKKVIPLFLNKRIHCIEGYGFGVAIGYTTERPEKKHWDTMETVCRSLVEAIGVDNNFVSYQFIIKEGKVYLIEAMGRLMGGNIRELIYFSTGIDLLDILIDVSLGKINNISCLEIKRHAAMLFLTSRTTNTLPGTIKSIEGIRAVKQKKGILSVTVNLKEGDKVPLLISALDRFGSIISVGGNAQEALLNAQDALNMLSIKTEQ